MRKEEGVLLLVVLLLLLGSRNLLVFLYLFLLTRRTVDIFVCTLPPVLVCLRRPIFQNPYIYDV